MKDAILKKIVDEIISSEQSYLKQLDKLQNYFSKPVEEKQFLPSHAHAMVFNQLPTICQMNQKLFEELSNGNEECVGKAFIRLGPFLKAYSTYANSFQKCLSLLEEWQSKNNDFKLFVTATESRPEVQSKLTALLIAPIQRIPRYRLLLEELLKVIDSSCSYYNDVRDAHILVSEVAQHIDKGVDDAHALQRLLILQKALKNQQPNIIAPGRRLLKEGILNKVSRKGKGSQERMFFLFTDMIMYSKLLSQVQSSSSKADLTLVSEHDLKPNSLDCCCILPLRYCRVATVFGSNEHGITFRLQCSDEDLLLYSRNSLEGQEWISLIKETAQQALQKRKTLRKVSSKRKALRRPALQKFTYSDDEENVNSPESTNNAASSKSPCTAVNLNCELLKSQILKIKDCLTPPKKWLTPRKLDRQDGFIKKGISASKKSHRPSIVLNNNESPPTTTSINKSPKLTHLTYQNFSPRGSPHGISPLALCSTDNGTTIKMNYHSDFRKCYHLRNSVILTNKAKANFLLKDNGQVGSLDSVSPRVGHRKKRPLSELLTPRKERNKKMDNGAEL